MEGSIEESLVERQDIFHHMAVGLCFLVSVEIVPTDSPEPDIEGLLHRRELLCGEEVRHSDDPVLLEGRDDPLNHRGVIRATVERERSKRWVGCRIVCHQ